MALGDFVKKAINSNQLKMDDGEIELFDFRMGMLPTHTWTKLIERMYEEMGDNAFDLLFEAGKKHGEYAVNELGRKNEVPRKQFLNQTLESANILGLGEFSLEKMNLDERKIVFRVNNSPFPEQFEESAILSDIDRSVDELHRGMFHTVGREVLEGSVESVETHCEFQGDSFCRFVVRKE